MSLLTLLRPARAEDCENICQTHSLAVREICGQSYDAAVLEAWQELLYPESYLDVLSDAHRALWVIEYKGEIRGFFQIDFNRCQLAAHYVHPYVHRQGLGTALLGRAEDLARQKGLGFIRLQAPPVSESFYRLNGYEVLGTGDLSLNGRLTVECRVMRKFLTNCC